MAEALLRKYLANRPGRPPLDISSAGLIGNPERRADERAKLVAAEFGVSLDDHQPRQLTRAMVDWADVIFLMDYFNEASMRVKYPDASDRMFLLGAQRARPDGSGDVEIPDPVSGTVVDVRRCYRMIDAGASRLAEIILNGGSPDGRDGTAGSASRNVRSQGSAEAKAHEGAHDNGNSNMNDSGYSDNGRNE